MIKPPPAEFKPKLCKQKGYWESPPHGTSTVECETIHFILFTIKETVQLLGVQQLLKDDIYPASKGFIRARPQTERVEGKKGWSGGGGGEGENRYVRCLSLRGSSIELLLCLAYLFPHLCLVFLVPEKLKRALTLLDVRCISSFRTFLYRLKFSQDISSFHPPPFISPPQIV